LGGNPNDLCGFEITGKPARVKGMIERPRWWNSTGMFFACMIFAGGVVSLVVQTPNTVGGGAGVMFVVIVLAVILKASVEYFFGSREKHRRRSLGRGFWTLPKYDRPVRYICTRCGGWWEGDASRLIVAGITGCEPDDPILPEIISAAQIEYTPMEKHREKCGGNLRIINPDSEEWDKLDPNKCEQKSVIS
jgi:hypothetical protein